MRCIIIAAFLPRYFLYKISGLIFLYKLSSDLAAITTPFLVAPLVLDPLYRFSCEWATYRARVRLNSSCNSEGPSSPSNSALGQRLHIAVIALRPTVISSSDAPE